jgi:predicted transcriptional regulator
MSQLTLSFDRPLSRRSDPATSHQAADRAASFAGKHRALIWNALIDNGPRTPRELADITGMDYVAIQRRGAEMERAGLITRGPEVRDGQQVWRGIQ